MRVTILTFGYLTKLVSKAGCMKSKAELILAFLRIKSLGGRGRLAFSMPSAHAQEGFVFVSWRKTIGIWPRFLPPRPSLSLPSCSHARSRGSIHGFSEFSLARFNREHVHVL